MFTWDDFKAELRELKGAKYSLGFIVLFAVGVGWYAASVFYAERIAVLGLRATGATAEPDKWGTSALI